MVLILSALLSAGDAHAKRNFEERFAQAEIYRLDNDNPAALREYTSLIKVRPVDSRMHANLGWALVKMQKYKEGKAEIDKALLLNDDDPYAHQAAALYYMLTDDRAKTRFEYTKMVALDPKRDCHCSIIQEYLGIGPKGETKPLYKTGGSTRYPLHKAAVVAPSNARQTKP